MYVKEEHKPCMYLDILVCTLDDDMIVENKLMLPIFADCVQVLLMIRK